MNLEAMKELLVEVVIRPLVARRDVLGNYPTEQSALHVSLSLAMLAISSCERVADTYRNLDRYSKEPYLLNT